MAIRRWKASTQRKDVSFDPTLGLVVDRALGERRFHIAEGVLGAGEPRVDVPEVLCREIAAVGLDQVAAVERGRDSAPIFFERGAELSGVGVDGQFVVAGNTRMALL